MVLANFITFAVFIEFLEKNYNFVQIRQVLEIKNIASLTITCFYWKQGCIKMCKHVQKFDVNKGYKLAIVIFISTCHLKNRNLRHTFQMEPFTP